MSNNNIPTYQNIPHNQYSNTKCYLKKISKKYSKDTGAYKIHYYSIYTTNILPTTNL